MERRVMSEGFQWKRLELSLLIVYAVAFCAVVVRQSLQLSHDHYRSLSGLRRGWMPNRLNDISDAQWRNFRANLPILTVVFGIFMIVANVLRRRFHLKEKGMSFIWILLSLIYLSYLHGACIFFLLSIATMNFFLTKVANLVGYVIGPSGLNWLVSRLLQKDGLPVLGGIFTSFYVGTKLMFHIRDVKRTCKQL